MTHVIFYCTTCEYYNRVNLGMPNHIERQIEYDSLNDAIEHITSHDSEHNVIAKIEEEIS